jgi:hypothetical protein
MERKAFLQVGCRCGLGAAAAMLLAPAVMAEDAPSSPGCPQQQPELATQLHAWLVDFLAAVDAQLDSPARARLLQACGRAEVRRTALAGSPRPTVTLEQMAAGFRGSLGEQNVRLEGDRLEVAFGRCECPLVGPTPERLSDTWCECARGYMTELMSARLGRPVRAELVEAIKRGGTRCRWVFQV